MLNINRNKHPHLTCRTKLHAIYETQASEEGEGRRTKELSHPTALSIF